MRWPQEESHASYQELPVKCWKDVEKLDYLACKKELSRVLFFDAMTSL
jgi:hypothetical protein